MRKYVIFGFAYYSLFNLGLRAIGATIDCIKYYYIEKPKYRKVMKGKSVQYYFFKNKNCDYFYFICLFKKDIKLIKENSKNI